MFFGNIDRFMVIKYFFSLDIEVFVRSFWFYFKVWVSYIFMRVEIYGCKEGKMNDFFLFVF